jgi:hypothetical protein
MCEAQEIDNNLQVGRANSNLLPHQGRDLRDRQFSCRYSEHGIVYGGVTNGARQANRFQRSAIVEKSFMRGLQPSAVSYGVPDGPPAICQANASGDDAVRSIAGSTVE